MTKFVLEQSKCGHAHKDYFSRTTKYANFLSQFLELGMFTPCDPCGNTLEPPKNFISWKHKRQNTPYNADLIVYEQYQEAQERVLFEGFELHSGKTITNGQTSFDYLSILNGGYTVENAVHKSIELTPTAQKQIGL